MNMAFARCSYDDSSEEEIYLLGKVQTYARRWLVLFVAIVTIAMRGYNQSCYGPVNNWLAEYFQVESWQIDWLILVQSVIFLVASLPMSVVTMRMGYRTAVIAVTSSLTLGFILTTLGVNSRHGFPIALMGQGVMGVSNVISKSLPSTTGAIWFASNEVASVVAAQVASRGVGEMIGSFLPTMLVNDNSTIPEMRQTWVYMFSSLSAVSVVLCVASLCLISNQPPSPPSEAQARVNSPSRTDTESDGVLEEIMTLTKDFFHLTWQLFKEKDFIMVCLLFGTTSPVMRSQNILLSSMLRDRLGEDSTHTSKEVGLVLLMGWAMYIVGAFLSGLLLTATKQFKTVAVASVFFAFVSCGLVFTGMLLRIRYITYSGVVLQGLMVGSCNTALLELLTEVTYPNPTMFVTMISIISMGIFRLIYPLVGRLLLMYFGASACTLFPAVVTFIGLIIVVVIRPNYKRLHANEKINSKKALYANGNE